MVRERTNRLFPDIFDVVILTFIFAISLISLRLIFILQVTSVPCAEMVMTMGQVNGNLPVFKLSYYVTLLVAVFWAIVTFHRFYLRRKNWLLIFWHVLMFSCIFLIAVFSRSLVSQKYITPPDGTIAVAVAVNPDWLDYQDGEWSTYSYPACVWLEKNEIAVNKTAVTWDGLDEHYYSLRDFIGLGRPHMDLLAERQFYRALTALERNNFIEKRTCQENMIHYGQHKDKCGSDYWYKLPEGFQPTKGFLEQNPID